MHLPGLAMKALVTRIEVAQGYYIAIGPGHYDPNGVWLDLPHIAGGTVEVEVTADVAAELARALGEWCRLHALDVAPGGAP